MPSRSGREHQVAGLGAPDVDDDPQRGRRERVGNVVLERRFDDQRRAACNAAAKAGGSEAGSRERR